MEFVCTERRKGGIIHEDYIYMLFKRILLTTYGHMNVNYNEEASL